jgi:hypothetical protein
MKHADAKALSQIDALLNRIRALSSHLREKKKGIFYFKGKSVLHFHEHDGEIFADVRSGLGAEYERIRVDTVGGADALLTMLRSYR